jgi:hypothetical protein
MAALSTIAAGCRLGGDKVLVFSLHGGGLPVRIIILAGFSWFVPLDGQ